ncbi:MAG: hypothetical protein LC658_07585, partial [Bacteroidales bacterium]|nr:hypothetical protein [Bacteroidales bacterium]
MLIFLIPLSAFAQEFFQVENRLWEPQKDEVYLQEVSHKIPTESAIVSAAVLNEVCYVLMENQIFVLEGQDFRKVVDAPSGAERLKTVGSKLWVFS